MEDPQLVSLGENEYVPGVCNIGPTEIEKRKQFFIIGMLGIIVLALLFWFSSLSSLVYGIGIAILFIAGFGVGVGYFQWTDRFCVAFGLMGVFNFKEKVGVVEKIRDDEALARDRAKVLQMFGKSAITAIVYTAFVILIGILIDFPNYIIL